VGDSVVGDGVGDSVGVSVGINVGMAVGTGVGLETTEQTIPGATILKQYSSHLLPSLKRTPRQAIGLAGESMCMSAVINLEALDATLITRSHLNVGDGVGK
jgi:hypothetical protein